MNKKLVEILKEREFNPYDIVIEDVKTVDGDYWVEYEIVRKKDDMFNETWYCIINKEMTTFQTIDANRYKYGLDFYNK